MSGTKEGGKKSAATKKRKYGDDYYKRIGALGGGSTIGGFASLKVGKDGLTGPERAQRIGRRNRKNDIRTTYIVKDGKRYVVLKGTEYLIGNHTPEEREEFLHTYASAYKKRHPEKTDRYCRRRARIKWYTKVNAQYDHLENKE